MERDFWDPRPARVAVFRALQLGDMLCAVPALRALRAFLPGTHITLVGLPWARAFVERFAHLVDDFLPFPGWPGNPEEDAPIDAMLDSLLAARARRFDVAIQLHGSGVLSNRITRLLGAPRVAGFRPRGTEAEPWFMPWPDAQPEIHRYLSLMASLGVPLRGSELEMPMTPEDEDDCQALLARHRLREGEFVVIHPGARLRSRRWPAERFAAVGTSLAAAGWRVCVTGSPAERELTAAVMAGLPRDAVDLTGDTTLGSLAALLRRAALLVCNDTGVSHVAAAVAAPSVVIASGSDVARWAPLDASRHPVLWQSVPCRPCAHELCPVAGHPCATGVAVPDVLAQAQRILPERLPHAA